MWCWACVLCLSPPPPRFPCWLLRAWLPVVAVAKAMAWQAAVGLLFDSPRQTANNQNASSFKARCSYPGGGSALFWFFPIPCQPTSFPLICRKPWGWRNRYSRLLRITATSAKPTSLGKSWTRRSSISWNHNRDGLVGTWSELGQSCLSPKQNARR